MSGLLAPANTNNHLLGGIQYPYHPIPLQKKTGWLIGIPTRCYNPLCPWWDKMWVGEVYLTRYLFANDFTGMGCSPLILGSYFEMAELVDWTGIMWVLDSGLPPIYGNKNMWIHGVWGFQMFRQCRSMFFLSGSLKKAVGLVSADFLDHYVIP